MHDGFTKLYGSIINSTIWLEPPETKVVWITMLAMANMEGVVKCSVGALARNSGVSIEECKTALNTFLSPDPDSATKDFEGRRIREIDGGWVLLNHSKYREMRSRSQIKGAERQKRFREKNALPVTGVTSGNSKKRPDPDPEAYTDPDPDNKQPPKSPRGGRGAVDYQSFMDTWNSNIEGTPFPSIVAMTDKRKRGIRDLLADCPDALNMLVPVINYLSGIEFFTGGNDRKWIASFDYLLQKGKLVEYYEKSSNKQIPTQTKKQTYSDMVSDRMQQQHDAEMQKLMEQYR